MKFNASSSELLKHLNMAAGAISSKPVLPILEDYLFDVNGSSLTVTATNLETTITTTIDVSVEEEGKIAVPAKILLDTLKALPDQPITLSVNPDNRAIEITSAYGKYKLAGDNPDEYPEVQEMDHEDHIILNSDTLLDALGKTLFATSNDDLRIAMTGVNVQIDFNKVMFIATDAHKLVKFTQGNISTEHTGQFIIPKKALSLLRGILRSDQEVKVKHNKTNAAFILDDTSLLCRLIDATYPDYNAVIPVDNPNVLQIDRTEFLSSLKRIAIYSNKTTNQVVLSLVPGSLTISAQDLDFSNEATEAIPCEYDGDTLVIGFNGRFLIDMLTVLDTPQIKFELSTPNRAGIMLPDSQKESEDLMMLVMPVMMTN